VQFFQFLAKLEKQVDVNTGIIFSPGQAAIKGSPLDCEVQVQTVPGSSRSYPPGLDGF
jgi:hypothetical protein